MPCGALSVTMFHFLVSLFYGFDKRLMMPRSISQGTIA